VRAVYTSLDPATAILEVAVHTGFAALDTVAHVLTAATVLDPSSVQIVQPEDVPNPNWLRPGIPGAGQQAFGDALLARHPFVLVPSAVSSHSWNLIFIASAAASSMHSVHRSASLSMRGFIHRYEVRRRGPLPAA
jgi:RES domain-containing protein